jgi:hypothetical protein
MEGKPMHSLYNEEEGRFCQEKHQKNTKNTKETSVPHHIFEV